MGARGRDIPDYTAEGYSFRSPMLLAGLWLEDPDITSPTILWLTWCGLWVFHKIRQGADGQVICTRMSRENLTLLRLPKGMDSLPASMTINTN